MVLDRRETIERNVERCLGRPTDRNRVLGPHSASFSGAELRFAENGP